jgi:prepilin-type N-terminal cleavage/methylation domain-containing protein
MLKTFFCLGFFSNKYRRSDSDLVYSNSGWTLLETMIVSVITGILASIAIVNMLGIMNKNKVQNSLYEVKGALQEAQRNAIKMGKECKVVMDADINPTYLSVDTETKYVGCLSSKGVDLSGINVTENFPGSSIRFSYKGNSTNLGTIVFHSSKTQAKYCLVFSNLLGIMRSGVYTKEIPAPTGSTSGVDSDYCKSSI